MQDRPTAIELIAAVHQFLEQELLPAQEDQRLRFRTRVAANALAILQRELTAGPALIEEEYERLRALLPASSGDPADGALTTAEDRAHAARVLRLRVARHIRDGAADHGPWREAVIQATLASVQAKLAVSAPASGARRDRA